jgi:hypothetical protein
MADLVILVLSGATASLSIFVATYGGLAVIGDSAADPNPYVVFVLCLVAALFSEDVWPWLRRTVLGQVTSGGASNSSEGQQEVAPFTRPEPATEGGDAASIPLEVGEWVGRQHPQDVQYEGELGKGAVLSGDVQLLDVAPDPNYRFARLNGKLVLVAANSRQIVAVY